MAPLCPFHVSMSHPPILRIWWETFPFRSSPPPPRSVAWIQLMLPLGVSLNCSGLHSRFETALSLPSGFSPSQGAAGRCMASTLSPCIIHTYIQDLAPGTACATGLLPNTSCKEPPPQPGPFIVLDIENWPVLIGDH